MRCIILFLFFVASIAIAKEPTSQWKPSNFTLKNMIENGYTIVSISSDQNSNTNVYGETFFLQKSASVFKCSESHIVNSKTQESSALFMCFELVQPH